MYGYGDIEAVHEVEEKSNECGCMWYYECVRMSGRVVVLLFSLCGLSPFPISEWNAKNVNFVFTALIIFKMNLKLFTSYIDQGAEKKYFSSMQSTQ